MKKNFTRINKPRIIIEWGIVLLIVILFIITYLKPDHVTDFEAYCPFGGIQALGSFLISNVLACSMTSTQIVMGVLLALGVVLFSKLFCSYICPIGTISEWLGKLGEKLNIRITIKGFADKAFRSLKYILLFVTLYFTFHTNELFCKEYDPYYALTSGFGRDVVILYASLAIVVVILGSIFIRLFWCKYLCPLGAISNIFKFTGFFAGILVIYFILLKFGIKISYVWPLAIISIGGYLLEISGYHFRFFPLIRVVRNDDVCTNCQLCTIHCPQGIDVAKLDEVHDADCNLCGDCLLACPEKGALQLSKKKDLRWLPPTATVFLILLGLYLGSTIEIPTINQKWYNSAKMAEAKTVTISGLKNIKCYGSSMAFASKMKKVKGVLGVATFVDSHKVKIYYDPKVLNKNKIEESIFIPEKAVIRKLPKNNRQIKVATVKIKNFFDPYDFEYLSLLLKQKTKAVALETQYSCPVIVKIFFPGNEKINPEILKKIIESKQLNYDFRGDSKSVKLNFKVSGLKFSTIPPAKYYAYMFSPYHVRFNNYNHYNPDIISIYRVPMGTNSTSRRKLPYLASHLSNNKGIVGLKTFVDSEANTFMDIAFVDTLISPEKIFQMLNSDTLYINYKGGKKGKVLNFYHFKQKGKVLSIKEGV